MSTLFIFLFHTRYSLLVLRVIYTTESTQNWLKASCTLGSNFFMKSVHFVTFYELFIDSLAFYACSLVDLVIKIEK